MTVMMVKFYASIGLIVVVVIVAVVVVVEVVVVRIRIEVKVKILISYIQVVRIVLLKQHRLHFDRIIVYLTVIESILLVCICVWVSVYYILVCWPIVFVLTNAIQQAN